MAVIIRSREPMTVGRRNGRRRQRGLQVRNGNKDTCMSKMRIPSFLVLALFCWNYIKECDAFSLYLPSQKTKELLPRIQGRTHCHRYHPCSNVVVRYARTDDDGQEIRTNESTDTKRTNGIRSEELLLSSNSSEIEVLRARADELRAEARAMELELRQKAAKERQERDAITDELIATLFLPLQYQDPKESSKRNTENEDGRLAEGVAASNDTNVIDARVLADRLQQGKFSRPQIMAVVDRIYEQHNREIDEIRAFTILKDSQQEEDFEPKNYTAPYKDYFHVLTKAAWLLDESIAANSMLEGKENDNSSSATKARKSPPKMASTPPSIASPPSQSKIKSSDSSSSSISSSVLFVTSGQLTKLINNRMTELRQRREMEIKRKSAMETNKIASVSPPSPSSDHTALHFSGMGSNNSTTMGFRVWSSSSGETPSFIPLWVPSPYIPYILSLDKADQPSSSRPGNNTNGNNSTAPFAVITNSSLEAAELNILKNKVLLDSRFYITSSEFAPGAALFRGNFRTPRQTIHSSTTPSVVPANNRTSWFKRQWLARRKQTAAMEYDNTAMVFADIQNRLEREGLQDRVQLFVLPDPGLGRPTANSRRPSAAKAAMSTKRLGTERAEPSASSMNPVILALPKAVTPDESKLKKGWIRKLGKGLCYPLAAFTTFVYSFMHYIRNPYLYDALVNQRQLKVLSSCIPLALGVIAIQIIHEAAHYFVAKRRKMKIGSPVPIPSYYSIMPFFGSITPLRSFPSTKRDLFDFALSGPMTALAASLGLVFSGALLTARATAVDIATYPFLPAGDLKSSFLLGSILSWLLPKTMMLPLAQPIPMHPFLLVGSFGLVTSALNLLPIFRLDGGRACFAAMGHRSGTVISLCMAFCILWSHRDPLQVCWLVFVALFQSRLEIPCRDECTDVDDKRRWIWLASFLLSMSILLPFKGL